MIKRMTFLRLILLISSVGLMAKNQSDHPNENKLKKINHFELIKTAKITRSMNTDNNEGKK